MSNGDQSTPGKVFPVTRDKKLSMYIDQLHFDEFFQKKAFHCNNDHHTGRKASELLRTLDEKLQNCYKSMHTGQTDLNLVQSRNYRSLG